MANVELVIKIPEETYEYWKEHKHEYVLAEAIANGISLPKGHGKIVDIGKIDNDKIESYNPIICLTVNGENIEAVSLDYLDGLTTLIKADKEQEI